MNLGLWQERFREHLELAGRSARTVETYTDELKFFFGYLEDSHIDKLVDITREVVEGYRLELHQRRKADGQPLAWATQGVKLAAVLAFLTYLHRARFLLVNPGTEVARPKEVQRLPRDLLDEDEVLRLLEAPETATPLGLRDRAILEVLYSSAVRNTELRQLTLDDLDLARGQLVVQAGKGGKPRVVPLGEEACAWCEEYLRNGRPWFSRVPSLRTVFLSSRGRSLDRDALCAIVRKTAEKAGLEKRVTPHVLRHCCATHMLRRRAGIRHLQEMLGHASAQSTQRYTLVEISDLREVHQRCHPREGF